jgi:putative (di)nucleoside polyphosphate hydrolase
MTPDQIARLPYRPCVGVMLVNPAGQVFVGQRRDNHQDAWQMPQGGVDPGEELEPAALRELWEETGVTPDLVRVEAWTKAPVTYDLPPDLVPKFWKGRYRGQSQHWALMRFLGTDDQIDIQTAHPEFSAWRWADPKDLVPLIVPFKRAAYARVVDELGALI